MLEFSKKILQKVSFDKSLFEKELRKSLKWMKPDDALILKAWCIATFGHVYGDVVSKVFDSFSV